MITKIFKLLVLASFLCLAILSSQTVLAWDQPPAGTPPACNTDPKSSDYREGCNPPINTGSSPQVKKGDLVINGTTTTSKLVVNGQLITNNNSFLNWNAYMNNSKSIVFNSLGKSGVAQTLSGQIWATSTYLGIGGVGPSGSRLVRIFDNLSTANLLVTGNATTTNLNSTNVYARNYYVCSTSNSCSPLNITGGESLWTEKVKGSEIVYNGDRIGVGRGVDNPTSGVTLALGANSTGFYGLDTLMNFVVTGVNRLSIDSLGNVVLPLGKRFFFNNTANTVTNDNAGNIMGLASTLDLTGPGVAPDRKVRIYDKLMTDNVCTLDGRKCGLTEEIIKGGDNLWATSGPNIYNKNTGNVGIGTADPSQILDVVSGKVNGSLIGFRTLPTVAGGQGGLLGVDTTNKKIFLQLNTSPDYSLDFQGPTKNTIMNVSAAGDVAANSFVLSGVAPALTTNALYASTVPATADTVVGGSPGKTYVATASKSGCQLYYDDVGYKEFEKTYADIPECISIEGSGNLTVGAVDGTVIPGTPATTKLYFNGKPVGDSAWTTSGDNISNSNTGNVFIGGVPSMSDQKFVVKNGNAVIETSDSGTDRRGLVFKNAGTGGFSTIFSGGGLYSDLGFYVGGDAASNLTMQVGQGKVSIPSSQNNSLVVGMPGNYGTDEVGVFTTKTVQPGIWAASITSANANAKGLRVYNNGGAIGNTALDVSLPWGSALKVDGKGDVTIPQWLFANRAMINKLDFDNNSIYFDGGWGARINATAIGNGQALRFYEGSAPREQYGMMLDHDTVTNRSRLLVEKICNYDGSKCIRIDDITGGTVTTPSPVAPPTEVPAPYFSVNGVFSSQSQYYDLPNRDTGYNIIVYNSVAGCQVLRNGSILQNLNSGSYVFVDTAKDDSNPVYANTPYFPKNRGYNEDVITLSCPNSTPATQTMYVSVRPSIVQNSFSVVRDGGNLVYQWSTDSGVKSGANKANPDYTLTCKVDPLSVTYYERSCNVLGNCGSWGESAQNNTPVSLSNDGYSSKANVCKSNNNLYDTQRCVMDAYISCWTTRASNLTERAITRSLSSEPTRAHFDQTY